MIDICVTHFGNKYSSKYITNLENAIGKNYSKDFNFIVKTDCPNLHWDKISFFECDKPRIIMDIDFVITSKLDELIDYEIPEDSLAAFPRWWRDYDFTCSINGGFYKINPGLTLELTKEKFYSDPLAWMTYIWKTYGHTQFGKGEQDFVEKSKINIKLLPGEWLGIYTVGCARPEKVITLKQIEDKYFHEYGLSLVDGEKFGI
jgi:hypothetical protein